MRKNEVVKSVAQQAGISQVQARKIINTVLNVIINALEEGDRVNLAGFGAFEIQERHNIIIVDPKTGEDLADDTSKTVIFTPGSALRDIISDRREFLFISTEGSEQAEDISFYAHADDIRDILGELDASKDWVVAIQDPLRAGLEFEPLIHETGHFIVGIRQANIDPPSPTIDSGKTGNPIAIHR